MSDTVVDNESRIVHFCHFKLNMSMRMHFRDLHKKCKSRKCFQEAQLSVSSPLKWNSYS